MCDFRSPWRSVASWCGRASWRCAGELGGSGRAWEAFSSTSTSSSSPNRRAADPDAQPTATNTVSRYRARTQTHTRSVVSFSLFHTHTSFPYFIFHYLAFCQMLCVWRVLRKIHFLYWLNWKQTKTNWVGVAYFSDFFFLWRRWMTGRSLWLKCKNSLFHFQLDLNIFSHTFSFSRVLFLICTCLSSSPCRRVRWVWLRVWARREWSLKCGSDRLLGQETTSRCKLRTGTPGRPGLKTLPICCGHTPSTTQVQYDLWPQRPQL